MMLLGSNRGAGVRGRVTPLAEEPLDLGSLVDNPSDVYPTGGGPPAISGAYGISRVWPLCNRVGPHYPRKERISREAAFPSDHWSLDIL